VARPRIAIDGSLNRICAFVDTLRSLHLGGQSGFPAEESREFVKGSGLSRERVIALF
jgi:hypothetical protein